MEFSNLGKHCDHCRLRTFTPSECDKCHQAFCENHRSYSTHECAVFIAESVTCTRRHAKSTAKQAKNSHQKCFCCKERVKFVVKCNKCKYSYCVEHRNGDLSGGHTCVEGGWFKDKVKLEPKKFVLDPNIFVLEMFKIWLKKNHGKHANPIAVFSVWFEKKNTVTKIKPARVVSALTSYYRNLTPVT